MNETENKSIEKKEIRYKREKNEGRFVLVMEVYFNARVLNI